MPEQHELPPRPLAAGLGNPDHDGGAAEPLSDAGRRCHRRHRLAQRAPSTPREGVAGLRVPGGREAESRAAARVVPGGAEGGPARTAPPAPALEHRGGRRSRRGGCGRGGQPECGRAWHGAGAVVGLAVGPRGRPGVTERGAPRSSRGAAGFAGGPPAASRRGMLCRGVVRRLERRRWTGGAQAPARGRAAAAAAAVVLRSDHQAAADGAGVGAHGDQHDDRPAGALVPRGALRHLQESAGAAGSAAEILKARGSLGGACPDVHRDKT
mmetsp:Transcript_19245/g.54358  ORF Transcript_19245/g.54358 Transcript_19245/m.54358 type:complete len:268 (+) Transcript_19245:340-1143(+)